MNNKSENKIMEPWDKAVEIRALDLEQATDYSYIHIIKPWVLDNVLKYTKDDSHILDIGCGCGYLTNCIYKLNRHNLLGIDNSQFSIDYAKKKYSHIRFERQDICTLITMEEYELCTAVMVLNNCPQLDQLLMASYRALKTGGHMLIVLPHPCFWPVKHISKDFFYTNDGGYEILFSTKGRSDYNVEITYYHRSISKYIDSLQKNGFQVEKVYELCETSDDLLPDIMCIHAIK